MEKSLKILVVDGSRVSRKLITKALMSELVADTLEIAAVGTAETALDLLATERFDLITSSLLLPDMYGLELCRAVRLSGRHRFTPFIVITAEPHKRLMKNGFAAGVTDYYDKTQGYKNLISFVRAFVERNAPLKGKVLYLEDNVAEARVLTTVMQQYGLEVRHTASAEQALGMLNDTYDLVVLDFYLEGDMSGGDFLHNVRCGLRRSRETLPVLVITANEDPDIQPEIFHAQGNEFITKPVNEEVLIAKLRSLLQMQRQAGELRRQRELLRRLKARDRLTGCYSRDYLLENADRLIRDEENYPLWMVALDLDEFRAIREAQGIQAGDRVIAEVGRLLKQSCHGRDYVFHTGTKDFVVILTRRSHEQCEHELEQLRTQIENLKPDGFLVTASMGVATNLGHAYISLDELWSEADRAMRRAKERGRNRVVSPSRLRSSDRMLLRANRGYL